MLQKIFKRILLTSIVLTVLFIILSFAKINFYKVNELLAIITIVVALLSSSDKFTSQSQLPSGYKDFFKEEDYESSLKTDIEPTMYIVLSYSIPVYFIVILRIFFK